MRPHYTIAIFSLFLSSCSTTTYYVATKDTIPNISRYNARIALEESLRKCTDFTPTKNSPSFVGQEMKLTDINWVKNNLELKFEKVNNPLIKEVYILDFTKVDIPKITRKVDGNTGEYTNITDFKINEKYLRLGFSSSSSKFETAKQFVDALYILKYKDPKSESNEELEKFKTIANEYILLNSQSEISEEVRKYIVQAENATEEKRFLDAINLYDSAIKISPSYPQAHFNKSLLLAQTDRYYEAITEMKKYLLLVPEATNARAAQDKIYEWEGKTDK